MPTVAPLTLHGFFGRGGLLQEAHPGYEFRRSQLEMAQAVEEALAERRHLFIEAGTGTGKTLAYLVPALLSGRRVLLSTGTRNLQEQLVGKDVPLLAKALGRELRVVNMKGRQNYACRQKIEDLESQPALLDLEDLDHYRAIRAWAKTSATGDQAELEFLPENHPLWQRLNARRETCTGQKCPRYDQCFLTQLHQRAAEAELVVVNHHLFFADLVLKRQELAGVLPPYEAVVFDEAHELEATAGQYFGVAVSSYQVEDIARDVALTLRLKALATPEREQRMERFRASGQRLFLQFGQREGRAPFENRERFLADNPELYDEFMQALDSLESGLEALPEKPEEAHNLLRRLKDMRTRLAYLLESREPGVVYWIDRRGRGVFVQAAPIDVAELLREVLFTVTDTVILTSATLAVEGGFDYVRGRLGVEHAREQVVSSPFQYPRQALLYLPEHLPPPNAAEFGARAGDEIESILQYSAGRAFVLFTSYAQMRLLHQRLEGRLPFPLLLQGTAPRNVLLDRFRGTSNAVLFATSSFWQGVDVQGEQLSCVIVDKLPFAAPSDPLVAARIRSLQQQGRNAFMEFQVPEAVLALKQGFGRLIRSATDRGVLALLDHRVLRKPYGRNFLRSLPEFACTTQLDDVRRFFDDGRMPPNTFTAGPAYGAAMEIAEL